MNKTISYNIQTGYKLALAGALLTVLTYAVINNTNFFIAALPLLIVIPVFLKKPELPLAVIFNGTFVYFYLTYKMGLYINRTMTGSFYALLVYSFLLAEIVMLTKGHIRFRISLVDVLFSALFLLIFVSYLLFSTNNEIAYKKILYAPMLAIAPYFGARLLFSITRIKKFLKYSILIPAALMMPAFYELFHNPLFTQRTRFSMYMFEDSLSKDNPILFGNMYAILMIIFLVRRLELRKLRLWHLLPLGLCMYFVLLSGSRGVLVSFVVSMVFYLFVISKIRLKTKFFIISAILFLSICGYMLLPENLTKFYQYTISTEAREDSVSSIQMRFTKWDQAIHDISEHPLMGLGAGNSDNGLGHPHNIVLESAAELGIIGLSIFLLLCYAVARKAMKFIKTEESFVSNMLMKIAFVLFVYSLIHSMFSGIITDQIRLYTSMGLIVCLDNLRLETTGPQTET